MKPKLAQSTKVLAKRLGYDSEQMLAGFIPAGIEDLEHIISWRTENMPEQPSQDDHGYLRWRYNFGDSINPGNSKSYLWLLKIDGQILAMMGAQHHILHADGKLHDIAYPLDLLVRKDLNGSGLGAWINLAMQDKYPVLLVIGGGTRESAGLIRRMFHAMPNRKTWKLPLSAEGTLRRLLGNKPLARALSTIADPLLSLRRRLHSELRPYKGIRFEAVNHFPDTVGSLSRQWPAEDIYLDRSASFLNWRFMENPGIDYHALLFYRDDQMIGYVVYHFYYATKNAQLQAGIDDLMWQRKGVESEQRQLLQHILTASIRHLIADKARLIILASYGTLADTVLNQLGFRLRDDEQKFSIHCGLPNADYLYDAERWYLSNAEAHGPNY
jgi:hypothetical protein